MKDVTYYSEALFRMSAPSSSLISSLFRSTSRRLFMDLTLIARVRDGLILATSIEGSDGGDTNLVKYSNQAKMLFKKLHNAPQMQSIESGPYMFHYVIKDAICCLCLCQHSFPRKLAFAYLEDVAQEFLNQNATRIDQVVRPYHFLEFDQYIQQAKKKYADRSRYAMSAVSNELQDVARIMVSNIEDVIHRGEALNILEAKASDLSGISKKYREDAKALNRRSIFFKIAVSLGIFGVILLIGRFIIF
ncbi:unnamed protein product [Cylicocyclus nassatus]|uniref:Uncharacterized protein n=1 Tax=Cylicocyclus nassatus TaxID=53992 RepID=A0AA36GLT8_CYLNA|nr:unnamed protein product [Cylicocyclus nassatus]